jgi:hypothetical protein
MVRVRTTIAESEYVKRCCRCEKGVDEVEFGPFKYAKDGLQSACRPCKRQYDVERHARISDEERARRLQRTMALADENRRKLYGYLLAHPCIDCGEKDPVVLEFDHVTEDKTGEIGMLYSRSSWARVLREIEKCVVRCANCHRRRTAEQGRHFKFLMASGLL